MDRICHNCRHLRDTGREAACHCVLRDALVSEYGICDDHEFRVERCMDCRYCVFEPNCCNPEQELGICMRQSFPRQSDGQEYIDADTPACCEFHSRITIKKK